MVRLARQKSNTQHGSMVVEFALVLPVLILLTFAIVQYGIMMNTTAALSNISREAARYQAVHGTEAPANVNSAMQVYASTVCSGTSIRGSDITLFQVDVYHPATNSVSIGSTAARAPGDGVKVTITYNLRKKIFMSSGFAGLSVIPSATSKSTTMIIE